MLLTNPIETKKSMKIINKPKTAKNNLKIQIKENEKVKINKISSKLYNTLHPSTKPKAQNAIETINALHGKTTPKNAKVQRPRPKSEQQKEKSVTYTPVLTVGTVRNTKEESDKNRKSSRTKSFQKKSEHDIKLNEGSLSTEASSHFRGRIEDYAVGKEIGKGAYAVVKQALHKPTSRKMAVKIYEKVKLLDAQRKNSVKREIEILKKLDNMNIVKLIEVIDNSKQVINTLYNRFF